MALQQESPEQKEARMERMREYCREKPDTEGCDEILAEEEDTQKIVEAASTTLIISVLSSCLSSIAMIAILMMVMKK